MKSLFHPRSGRVPPSETLNPSSSSSSTSHRQRPPRSSKENVDPNSAPPSESSPFRSPSVLGKPSPSKSRSPLPPRPPNPLKRKLCLETLPENGAPPSIAPDSGVQVIVRIRPANKDGEEADQIVQKISPNSISILEHTFTFDSVADSSSTQQDVFSFVGLPLVENCLAGFNSSIFAYGQTGSGKTYTMWGPPTALLEENLSNDERGLTPRVFELLFSRIKEEQAKHSDKQLNYQCRCSFLEIYNEQITDLLEPVQKNLQIREDVKTGVYVDYLTEEYVCSMKDVTRLLIKGLGNRRTGATSINAESSRSHCVFTCVVESRSKRMDDGLSILKSSRINLVDLAGSERQKLTGAAGERLREAGNINRSLSQLGNLINILAEVSQSGKQRHIPYRDSKLTFLLQESLGGNAKLAMLCAISPSQSCKSETLSTLRFAQRAKAIKNKAVINEITQDDVNVLRDQIRQLKDELLRMKSNGASVENNGSYSTGWNARRSLNLLRMSLSRPTVLPVIKDDSDEEMEIDEDDVEKPSLADPLPSSCEHKLPVQLENLKEDKSCLADSEMISRDLLPMHRSSSDCNTSEIHSIPDASVRSCELQEMTPGQISLKSDVKEYGSAAASVQKSQDVGSSVLMTDEQSMLLRDNNILTGREVMEEKAHLCEDSTVFMDSADVLIAKPSPNSSSSPGSIVSASSLSILPCQALQVLRSPTPSISPTVDSCSRKSLRISSAMSASQKIMSDDIQSDSGVLMLSFADTSSGNPHKRKNSVAPNDHLAASLHHGLQIIDNHQRGSALRRSSFRFSMRPIDLKPLVPSCKVDVGIQTLPSESEMPDDFFSSYICTFCKNKASTSKLKDTTDDKDLQLVIADGKLADGKLSSDKLKKQVPKAVERVLTGAIRREMALEDHCAKQSAEIVQLNRLVQQYKHERECNAIIGQTHEDKISRLESLMDGILPTEEFMEEEFLSLRNEHKLLKEKYENHPEVLRVNIELKRIQNELDGYRNFFDMGERDVLMEEIQDLRTQLQYYVDTSVSTRRPSSLLKLTHLSQPIAAPVSKMPDLTEESAEKKLEQERHQWTETESKWISLTEELRLELEACRSLAEKQKQELDTEKKCTEELKEALQTAMQGHARILEQYADLQEKHIALHGRHRKISDGIEDVKRAAVKAGVKGTESRFINALAAEISALRVEREKERRYWRDENKGLQAQLRDTAEAVQAAGELLVRLKEAEEAVAFAQKRASVAEQETEKAYQEVDKLKENYDREIVMLNQCLAESRLPKEAIRPDVVDDSNTAKYDGGESSADHRWKEEFEPFGQGGDGEFSKGTDPSSWFSGYDRCNI